MMGRAVQFLFLLSVAIGHSLAAKPNIVYIITDDQDIKLGSLSVQPQVKSLLIDKGMLFHNAFVTTPVCCPSRSSTLTGKFVHNHHTYENSVGKGCNAPSWRSLNENKTMGAYMTAAGYKTGFFGKYLNNYALKGSGVGVEHIPPGWNTWYTLQGNSKFYHYTVSNQGVAEQHGGDYEADYFTDRVRDHAVQFISDSASGSVPFFTYISTPAPHRPATPAPQYEHKFDGKKAPRTPSYNDPGQDKHWLISQGTPTINSSIAETIDTLYEMRLETLLSVDDLVAAVVKVLEDKDVLDNTYIFYNSDHGYHLGQFKQQGEKRQIYDENIRVPLIVRGPGVKPSNSSVVVLNIDLAPTFLDLAGSPIPDDMDGQSFKDVLMGQVPELETETSQFLVEYFGEGGEKCMGAFPFYHDCQNNTFMALRIVGDPHDVVLSHYYTTDSAPPVSDQLYFQEYYNITQDLWQVQNTNSSLSKEYREQFEDVLDQFLKCSGTTCRELRKKKINF